LDLAAAHREEGLLGWLLQGLGLLVAPSTAGGQRSNNMTGSAGCNGGRKSLYVPYGRLQQQQEAERDGVLSVGGYQQLIGRALQQSWPVHSLEQLLRQGVEEPGLSRGQIGDLLRVSTGVENTAGRMVVVKEVAGAEEVWMEQCVEQNWWY
jgi:hypothetical protein